MCSPYVKSCKPLVCICTDCDYSSTHSNSLKSSVMDGLVIIIL